VKIEEKSQKDRTLGKGRSFCRHAGTVLTPEDKTLKEILGFKTRKNDDVLHSDAAEEDRERDYEKKRDAHDS